MKKINEHALGTSIAGVSAIVMLALGVGANVGIYRNAAQMMMQWHGFFSLTAGGIVSGMIEAAVFGYIGGWLIARFYNLSERK